MWLLIKTLFLCPSAFNLNHVFGLQFKLCSLPQHFLGCGFFGSWLMLSLHLPQPDQAVLLAQAGPHPGSLSHAQQAPGHDTQRGKSVRWSQHPGAAVVQVREAEPSPRRVPTDQAPHPWARCLGQCTGRGEAAELQKQSLHLASSVTNTNTKSPLLWPAADTPRACRAHGIAPPSPPLLQHTGSQQGPVCRWGSSVNQAQLYAVVPT